MPAIAIAQNEDSLLKQISEIEINLNTVESEENLYMNTVSFQSFYDVLSPMGEWIQITKEDIDEDLNDGDGQSYSSLYDGDEELLFIWKPAGSDNNWKPYMNGRWEYTDHGWLWVSADAWGNTTYNYGRWWNSPKYGWVWLPGYTWSPAWVRWKVSENYVGWAPLSPKAEWKSSEGITKNNYRYTNNDNDYVFITSSLFGSDVSNSNAVNQTQNSQLVKTTDDITDIKVVEDKIINAGPDVTVMEKRTGKTFIKRRIKFTNKRNRPVVGNDDIVLNREGFKKYTIDKSTNRPSVIDSPKKYKQSKRVKKIFKKWRKNKQHRRPRNR
jgi:hypothetical protein